MPSRPMSKSAGRLERSRAARDVACTFAMAAVSIAALLSDGARARLSGMLRDSLSLQGDARRLQHEFSVAAHFSQHGWDTSPLTSAHVQAQELAAKYGVTVEPPADRPWVSAISWSLIRLASCGASDRRKRRAPELPESASCADRWRLRVGW